MTEPSGDRNSQLETALQDYCCHISWRCAHQDRFPWQPDCRCGLTTVLRQLNLPQEWAEGAPVTS